MISIEEAECRGLTFARGLVFAFALELSAALALLAIISVGDRLWFFVGLILYGQGP